MKMKRCGNGNKWGNTGKTYQKRARNIRRNRAIEAGRSKQEVSDGN